MSNRYTHPILFMALQPHEDRAVATCGCVLERAGTGGDPAVYLCPVHLIGPVVSVHREWIKRLIRRCEFLNRRLKDGRIPREKQGYDVAEVEALEGVLRALLAYMQQDPRNRKRAEGLRESVSCPTRPTA